MTLHARLVWADAKRTLDIMEVSEDPQTVRIMFAACVTLLRTIGDVLDKVDKPNAGLRTRDAILRQWSRLKEESGKEPHIFWDFIKTQRDEVVHRYSVDASLANDALIVAECIEEQQTKIMSGPFVVDRFLLESGPYAGEDGRDLAHDALAWWNSELQAIEAVME